MGKRDKKKSRAQQKDKKVTVHSPQTASEESSRVSDTIDNDVVAVVKERKPCSHIEKGFNLNNLNEKLGSPGSLRCEDCREGAADKRGVKARGKHIKKKGSVDSKSESKAIWLCLECGHFACGGVGLPTTSQSHAVRHARQTRHPLVIQWGKPQLRWCFQCNSLIPVETTEESGEKKDVFLDVVKLIKTQISEKSSMDVEEVWFGSGSILSEMKAEGTVSSSLEAGGGYIVRGLVNLGNTCFFNSVMQNLLAMDKLREYFYNQDVSYGPLTIALKKLFHEMKLETGQRNVINPRSFFGCICSKAPQFRGYQQQDSHELLRCLLDGLLCEELAARKQINASREDGNSLKEGPILVDALFGGRISSTVSCTQCGHSSTVYEPYLDLSLPVPTKKPATRKVQPVSRQKKSKLPPKRGAKFRAQANKDTDTLPAQSISNCSGSSCQTQSTTRDAENMVASSGDVAGTESDGLVSMADDNGLASQHLSNVPDADNEQVADATVEQTATSFDDFTWMDYLVSNVPDADNEQVADATVEQTATSFDDFTWMDYLVSNVPDADNEQVADATVEQTATSFDDFTWMDCLGPETISDEQDFAPPDAGASTCQHSENTNLNNGLMESSQLRSVDRGPNLKLDSSSVNPWEDEVPLQVKSSEVLLLPYKEDSYTDGGIVKGEDEASSSAAGCRQEEADFDGFGDLFNEPEVSSAPVAGPSLRPGFAAAHSSESDPDEVDNSDSAVSVESCLAHFIKPELLSNDNAWECENCAKILLRQRLETMKKQSKTILKSMTNGGESLVLENGKMDYSNDNCRETEGDQADELKLIDIQSKERNDETTADTMKPSNSSSDYKSLSQESFSCPAVSSSSVDGPSSTGYASARDQLGDSQSSGNSVAEDDGDEGEEKTSKKVIVKRDATKRVLVDKAPPILTIHLKRFSQDVRGRLSKLNGHVKFGEILDLRPYMDARCTDREEYVYRLLGVVEHSGSMRGGHYVAYVKGGSRSSKGKTENEKGGTVWYHASDVYVREVSLDEVLRSEAYILFYEKIF